MFRYEPHTADVQIIVESATLDAAFGEVPSAFTGIFLDGAVKEKETRAVILEAKKPEQLLFDLLAELIYLKDAFGFVPARGEFTLRTLKESVILDGAVLGDALKKYKTHGDVKAPTYHNMLITQKDDVVQLRFVVDI